MKSKDRISLGEIIAKEGMENYTPEIDPESVFVTATELNRPALQLTGYYDGFDENRLQLIGQVEYDYLQTFDNVAVRDIYDELTSHSIPAIIYTHGREPGYGMIAACHRRRVPLLVSHRPTAELEAELTRWLRVQMAPSVTVHGVLVDVYGEGVLITGDSGIGKSEVALELIRRGHRLVADDVVDIRKVSDETLVGSAPELTRHMLELRGIGILDIMTMFGVESVKDTQTIDLVINLLEWDQSLDFDRLGLEEQYKAFLGNRVISHDIPVRPGRNIAVIVEAAAINKRAKKKGLNAAQVLVDRVDAKAGVDLSETLPASADVDK